MSLSPLDPGGSHAFRYLRDLTETNQGPGESGGVGTQPATQRPVGFGGGQPGFREKVFFSKMMVKVTHADEALYLQVMEPGDGRAVSTRGEGETLCLLGE